MKYEVWSHFGTQHPKRLYEGYDYDATVAKAELFAYNGHNTLRVVGFDDNDYYIFSRQVGNKNDERVMLT